MAHHRPVVVSAADGCSTLARLEPFDSPFIRACRRMSRPLRDRPTEGSAVWPVVCRCDSSPRADVQVSRTHRLESPVVIDEFLGSIEPSDITALWILAGAAVVALSIKRRYRL